MAAPKTLKDVLADPKTFADDVKFTLGDVETTLGELRGLSNAEQKRISDEAARIQQEQETLQKAQQNLAATYGQLVEKGLVSVDKDGNLLVNEPTQRTTTTTKSTKGVDYESDTYVGPIFKQLQDLQKQVVESNKRLEATLQGTRSLIENDRLHREFEAREWPEGTTFDSTLRDAAGKKLLDQYGRLDLGKLHEEVAKPIRLSQKDLDERINTRAEEIAREKLANVPRPGLHPRASVKPAFKNLDEAMAAAEQDPDIQQQLSQIVPGVM